MTRGINLRGHSPDRYRREVREPMTRLRAWLPGPCVWTSSRVRVVLESIMQQYPTVGEIPYKPAPATRGGLTCYSLRLTRQQRGMIDLITLLHGVSISEALRGIIAAWMEGQE